MFADGFPHIQLSFRHLTVAVNDVQLGRLPRLPLKVAMVSGPRRWHGRGRRLPWRLRSRRRNDMDQMSSEVATHRIAAAACQAVCAAAIVEFPSAPRRRRRDRLCGARASSPTLLRQADSACGALIVVLALHYCNIARQAEKRVP